MWGSSEGHNSNKSNEFGNNCTVSNVASNDIPVNICEVTSFNELNGVHLSDLTSDLSDVTRETWYYDANKGGGVDCVSCINSCTYKADNLVNVSSCVVHELDNTDHIGTKYDGVHRTDHSVAPMWKPTLPSP